MAEGVIFILWVLGGWSHYNTYVALGGLNTGLLSWLTATLFWPFIVLYVAARY